jgi:hypothetical protein
MPIRTNYSQHEDRLNGLELAGKLIGPMINLMNQNRTPCEEYPLALNKIIARNTQIKIKS